MCTRVMYPRSTARYEIGSRNRGLSSVLRSAEAILPREFRETVNLLSLSPPLPPFSPLAISQEVPSELGAARESESSRRTGADRSLRR